MNDNVPTETSVKMDCDEQCSQNRSRKLVKRPMVDGVEVDKGGEKEKDQGHKRNEFPKPSTWARRRERGGDRTTYEPTLGSSVVATN